MQPQADVQGLNMDYVELVHKTALMFACRRNYERSGQQCDMDAAERLEAEVKELLDRIRDKWRLLYGDA